MPNPVAGKRYGTVRTDKQKEMSGLEFVRGLADGTLPLNMIAQTDVATQVTEMVGSGPFTFSAADYVPGSKAVYLRNADYKPREEPASGTSGGKLTPIE